MIDAGTHYDVAVVGAGAAGIIAALFAARAGRNTVLLEGKSRPGAKILISGGGRCNVLPSVSTLEDFSTGSSRNILRNILGSWPLADVREFFETDLGVPLKCEETGKLFPRSDRARDVLNVLLEGCHSAGVDLRCNFRLANFKSMSEGGFELKARGGEQLTASRVVLATGGLSVPNTGSDGEGLRMLERAGHELLPTRPALVPLLASSGPWRQLAGLACPAKLTARRGDKVLAERSGDFLFTHRGFSGPVVLDVSEFLSNGAESIHTDVCVTVQWLASDGSPLAWNEMLRSGGAGTVGNVLRRHLPNRLAEFALTQSRVADDQRLASLARAARATLVDALEAWPLPVSGHEGFRKAEVTAGGVRLAEIKAKTLESRLVPDLYLCGELLDVTGRIGGFNFLWAWVSGRRAGLAAAS